MKSNKNALKQSLIQVQKTLILQDIEDDKKKNSKNKMFIKKSSSKNERDEKVLRNAYKNVITVITNLLDNIEDEKTNGKVNALGTQRIIDKNLKTTIKNPLKKIESYDLGGIKYTLNAKMSRSENILGPVNNNTLTRTKTPLKLSLNWKSHKYFTNDNNINYTEGSVSENYSSNLSSNSCKNNQTLVKKIYKKFVHKKAEKSFFKPKNRLSIQNKFNNSFINNLKKPICQKASLDLPSKSINTYGSSLSSFSRSSNIRNSIELEPATKMSNLTIIEERTSNNPINSFNSNEVMITKEEESKNAESNSPFSSLKAKIKDTDTEEEEEEENIPQNMWEIKNEENNIEMSLTDDLLNAKKKLKTKKTIIEGSNKGSNINRSTKTVILKHIKFNIPKINNKEKKYRCLLCKGYVYDSLDDEESDDGDINDCYFEPNSLFLYILDSITLICSFIILFYVPIYLAKRLFFCRDLSVKSSIIFFFIDFVYIFDFIINFYRSYYNFDEVLVKKNIKIFIHYFKTWLLFDLISSIPIYTILKVYETKCIAGGSIYEDLKLKNSGMHSHYYNINLNNMHYILLLIKVIKTFKIFKQNIATKKIKQTFYQMNILNNWGNVLLYALFFFSFLNFISCVFVFLGRNIDDSWIFINGLEKMSFIDIYIGATYYIVMTVTTVGYGDVLGKTKNEILFQIIMIIVGTCIYSWMISSVSNYVKKMSGKDLKYQEKMQILEEIKLNNHISEKLYNKIYRLLNYRKYREEETEKNVILESLPNSLKNTLLIEMYKVYINGFSFFKGIENKEFIVQIISKLNPIIGIRGDILIEEGEIIEEIIFIKNGVLSLEVWIDIANPEESIKNYLDENGFIHLKKASSLDKSSSRFNSTLFISNRQNHNLNTTFNNYFEKIEHMNEKALIENRKKLRILEIRKNEHFGDVPMFLNKKSPFYIRVNSRVADLLILKKLDAINISDKYPDVWKLVIKKPLENSKIIDNLTLKTLVNFCNLNGIKTTLFRKKNNYKKYPKYYLIPVIYKINKKKTNKKENDVNTSKKKEIINCRFNKTDDIKKVKVNKLDLDSDYEDKKMSNAQNSSFSFYDKKKNEKKKFITSKNKDSKLSSQQKNPEVRYKISVSNSEDKRDIINKNSENNNTNTNNNSERPIYTNTDNNSNFDFAVNDEISPNENFSIKLYDNEKPVSNTNSNNNLQKILPDNIYINNLNINYLGSPSEKKEENSKKIEKKFHNLEISSQSTTLEINSSYENINEITLNKYISNIDFRKEAKEYLIEKSKQYDSKLNPSFEFNKIIKKHTENKYLDIKKNSRIYKSSINNNMFLKSKKSFYANKEKHDIRKTSTKKLDNQFSHLALNNFQNLLMKSGKCNNINNIISKGYSTNSIDINLLKSQKTHGDLNVPIDNSYQNNFIKKKCGKSIDNNNSMKRRKKLKLKELDIISSNMEKTSQNLNQPVQFYAGLFNNIISKDYLKLKDSYNIVNSKRSYNNNVEEILTKKTEKNNNK